MDQGGFPGDKTPGYVGVGYWVLELVGLVTALVLLARPAAARISWFVATGVAAGPLVGFVLSRGPGLPDYTDDKGNWFEPLGMISLAAEGVLLLLALTSFARSTQGTRAASVAG
jgi:hypothetical protein